MTFTFAAGLLSKSAFFHEDYETVARRSSFGESSKLKPMVKPVVKPIAVPQPEIIHR